MPAYQPKANSPQANAHGEFAGTAHSQPLGDIEQKWQLVRSGSLKSTGNFKQKIKLESWENLPDEVWDESILEFSA